MRLRLLGLIITLALGILLAPLAAEAQQAEKVHRIGVLYEISPPPTGRHEGWVNALRELGYSEGQNVAFEFRWAAEKYDLLPTLAAELVQLKVDVILTGGTPAALAAKQVTSTLPIITLSSDPIGAGLVSSLGHPGSNVTGVFLPFADLAGKRLQLLKEAVPAISSVAVMWNPANQAVHLQLRETQVAAQTLGITLQSVEVRSPSEFDGAFSSITRRHAHGLIVLQDPVMFFAAKRIAEFTMKNRLPGSHAYREFVAAGGLMSYGVSLPGLFRAGAVYVDKIFKGAKPADLPMEQPTKFEFVINLKTAKALGLTIPQSVLIRADEVIQ